MESRYGMPLADVESSDLLGQASEANVSTINLVTVGVNRAALFFKTVLENAR